MRYCAPFFIVLLAACSQGAECTYDTDCPGLQVCSVEGACADRPADAGGGGVSQDAAHPDDTGTHPGDGGRDAGRDGGDTCDAGADACAGRDAGRDGGDTCDAGADACAGRDGGDTCDAGADACAGHDGGDGGFDGGDTCDAGADACAGSDAGDGGCVPGCAAVGDRACEGTAAYRECTASGGCLHYGAPLTCGALNECREGQCGRDECAQGAARCDGDAAHSVCDRHGTPFFTWGAPVACAAGEKCLKKVCCPPEMVEITGWCIDKFEAFAAQAADCSGTVYGRAADDYPAGFPDKVGDGGLTETQKVYGCSAQFVKPSAFITFYQAKRSCENSGKRLCTAVEWYAACAGPSGFDYPYGNQYGSATCNTEANAAADTGVSSGCVSGYGVYDLAGNLFEWVYDAGGTILQQPILGGAYNTGSASTCGTQFTVSSDTYSGARGWRCCR